MNNGKKPINKTVIILAMVFVLALGGMGAVIAILLNREPEQVVILKTPEPAPNVLVGMSTEEMNDLLRKQEEDAEKNKIIVSLPSIVYFENGKAEGNIDLDNVSMNKVAFTVDYLLDDGTSVMKTGLLAPGYTLQSQKLDVELPKGEYPISAIHTTYDENGVEIGKVGVAVTFVIKN